MSTHIVTSDQFSAKLPGGSNQHMRVVTVASTDENGLVNSSQLYLYHTNVPGGRSRGGDTWSDPDILNGQPNFDATGGDGYLQSGGFALAAYSEDGGATWTRFKYNKDDESIGIVGDGKVGDYILDDNEFRSLGRRENGQFYQTVQTQADLTLEKKAESAGLNYKDSTQNKRAILASNESIEADDAEQSQQADDLQSSALDAPEDINISGFESLDDERKNYGDWAYPLELRFDPQGGTASTQQDRMVISVYSPEGSVIRTKLNIESGDKRITRRLSERKGSVTLAIQNGIRDSNQVGWNDGTLNAIESYAVGASLKIAGSPNAAAAGQAIADLLGNAGKTLLENAGNNDYAKALKLYLAQEAVGVQGVLSRAAGGILNPNLELLFSRPELRPFNFDVILSPRDEPEGREVRSIIRFFKQAMAVRKSKSSAFLKSPHIFKIRYLTFDNNGKLIGDHPSINRIKECALIGCTVDYTPDNAYMTFDDKSRTMTQYRMQLSFKELDPIYENDYTQPIDHIGY